jgi:alpha-tubulin suppressor-like RCC1 family protein
MENMEEEEPGSFGFKMIDAADNYTAAVLKDGTIHTWGMNDRGQMGVGTSVGIDMVESENIPKQLDFTYSHGDEANTEPIVI